MTPRPFTLHVPDEVLADLRARLERVRWPDEAPGAGWQPRHQPRLHEGAGRVLARRATTGARTRRGSTGWRQFTAPVGGIDLHFIHEPGVGPGAAAAAALARLAGLDRGVRADHPDADRSRALRRRPGRRLHRRRALAARLRVLVPARPAALRRRRDRRPVRRADDRRARLPALRRAGRRLGRVHHLVPRRGRIPTGWPAST